ncbi:hypothetical protein KKF61_02105 [Patescibacteria group bacterium]|nr:hypothetical protein [Patescibacteria group bacterium]
MGILIKRFASKLVLVIVLAFAFSLCLSSYAEAITLIPPSLEIGLKPGKVYSSEIKLYNETASPVELYTEKTAFTAQGETGKPDFDFDADTEIGLVSWIDIEAGPIVVQPGQRYYVPLAINAPLDADPGGHYATIFFSTNPPEEGQVKISSKVGTLVFANVDGEVTEQVKIVEFDTSGGKGSFNRLPVEFFTRIQNSGNVHLKPTGSIVITNILGKESGSVDFNSTKGAILPDTTRRFDSMWEKSVVVEKSGNIWSNFWNEYSNEKNNFGFGQYKAEISITAGTNDSVTDNSSVAFWIIPWRMIVVWGLVVVIAVILVVALLKRYNAWIIKKSSNK